MNLHVPEIGETYKPKPDDNPFATETKLEATGSKNGYVEYKIIPGNHRWSMDVRSFLRWYEIELDNNNHTM